MPDLTEEWKALCQRQGYSPRTQVRALLSFIWERGMAERCFEWMEGLEGWTNSLRSVLGEAQWSELKETLFGEDDDATEGEGALG